MQPRDPVESGAIAPISLADARTMVQRIADKMRERKAQGLPAARLEGVIPPIPRGPAPTKPKTGAALLKRDRRREAEDAELAALKKEAAPAGSSDRARQTAQWYGGQSGMDRRIAQGDE